MNKAAEDSSETFLRAAILHYFQWLSSTSTGAASSRKGAKVLAALLEEFPELAKFDPPSLLVPELKIRFERYPFESRRRSFLENHVAFLERQSFAAATFSPAIRQSANIPNRPISERKDAPSMAKKAPPENRKRKDPPSSPTAKAKDGENAKVAKRIEKPPVKPTGASPRTTTSVVVGKSSTLQTNSKKKKASVILEKSSTPQTISKKKKASVVVEKSSTPETNLEKKEAPTYTTYPSWDERYEQLVHFHKGYGHCRVTKSSNAAPGLYLWVQRQRAQYRQKNLPSEKIDKLNELKFEWVVSKESTPWEIRLEELKEFQREHGHARVPRTYKKNPQLGDWVHNQRHDFRYKRACLMESDRLSILQSIGFEFNTSENCQIKSWDERFEQLVEFRRNHGHINVPPPKQVNKKKEDNGGLTRAKRQYGDDEDTFGRWFNRQMNVYCKYKNGDRSAMKHAQFKKLDDIGFGKVLVTSGRKKGSATSGSGHHRRDDDTWNMRLNQLRQYKEAHGDCNVPSTCVENKELGHWVRTQRKHYRYWKDGKQSSLTEARRHALDSIGFQWNPRPWMNKENRKKKQDDDDGTALSV